MNTPNFEFPSPNAATFTVDRVIAAALAELPVHKRVDGSLVQIIGDSATSEGCFVDAVELSSGERIHVGSTDFYSQFVERAS